MIITQSFGISQGAILGPKKFGNCILLGGLVARWLIRSFCFDSEQLYPGARCSSVILLADNFRNSRPK